MFTARTRLVALTLTLSALTLQACDPVPRRTLNNEEKAADMAWIYSQFHENYAPLDYKEARYGFKFDKLKTDYLAASALTNSNNEFYNLMMNFVSEFKDAHTSAALTNASLPDRAQVAYLGFTGTREGEVLVVTEILSGTSTLSVTGDASGATITIRDPNFPIAVGDKILKLDGVVLTEAIQKDILKFRNLGNDESNKTFHMNKLFNRVSTSNGLPAKDTAVLTVSRKDVIREVSLPWIVKDLYQFKQEQDAKKSKTTVSTMAVDDGTGKELFRLNLVGFNGLLDFPRELTQVKQAFLDGFRLPDGIAGWTSLTAADNANSTPAERLKKQRTIPPKAVMLTEGQIFPAYVSPESALDEKGKPVGQSRLVGYIYLDTFSPNGSEMDTVAEFKATLLAMQNLGVSDLVIDTINNGGGSLGFGMQLAQALSNEKVIMSEIQFRLSDTWLDEFQTQSLMGTTDSTKEYARRILAEMKDDQAKGGRLSRRYSSEVLVPFELNPNLDLTGKFKIVLLVNEMCASMCDIFAGILQDNKIATVVGTRSMGAGGNVVAIDQAPNSHLVLRQTESLIVRRDGSYVENNGVTPDVDVAVNTMTSTKYEGVRTEAVKTIFGKPAK